MTHRRTTLALALAACVALAGAAHARQPRLALNGRVVLESAEKAPRFTVRLYYPKEFKRPTLVTYTDEGGHFRFEEIDAGRYLLEVYHGDALVYQKALVVDEHSPQTLVITLRAEG